MREERIEMTTHINPDPHAEGFQWQPTNHVTAIIDDQDDVFSVIRRLKESGFSDEDISVFIRSDGLNWTFMGSTMECWVA